MNKNSKRRQAAHRRHCKQNGYPDTPFKKKAKPFPRPNGL